MRISPLDIRKQNFKSKMRGADPEEVRIFLDVVATEYEQVLQDNAMMTERLRAQDARLAEYRQLEESMRNSLVTAERIANESRESSEREARRLVQDAHLRAERILEDARERLQLLIREIEMLRGKKEVFARRFWTLIESQVSILQEHMTDMAEVDSLRHKVARLAADAAESGERAGEGAPSETGERAEARPADRPGDRGTTRPAFDRPPDRAAARSADRPFERPADRGAERPAERRASPRPADRYQETRAQDARPPEARRPDPGVDPSDPADSGPKGSDQGSWFDREAGSGAPPRSLSEPAFRRQPVRSLEPDWPQTGRPGAAPAEPPGPAEPAAPARREMPKVLLGLFRGRQQQLPLDGEPSGDLPSDPESPDEGDDHRMIERREGFFELRAGEQAREPVRDASPRRQTDPADDRS